MVDDELAAQAPGGSDQYEEHPLSQLNALRLTYDHTWIPTCHPLDWLLRRRDLRWAILQHISDGRYTLLPD